MKLDELEKRRERLRKDTESIFNNIDVITEESKRVAAVAHNSDRIIDNLDAEFERQTGLTPSDVAFLFFATGLQCARIFLVNNFTKIQNAGNGNKIEKNVHKMQNKVFDNFEAYRSDIQSELSMAREYYAPLNQIIGGYGVPYDAQNFLNEKYDLFKGGNHRYSTLGHDPILGLIFGTANILTNSITTVKAPLIKSHHVVYEQNIVKAKNIYKSPKIGRPCSTAKMLQQAGKRIENDFISVIAAIIKQILHIGTDMFTPCGIHLPGANLVLSTEYVERISKYITTGDILKTGASAGIATLINVIISTVHTLLYDARKYSSREIYSVKTKKIIMYSNAIATSSNILLVGAKLATGNVYAIKELDLGGLIVTIHRLIHDQKLIRQIKEEFVFGSFRDMIQGEELNLLPHNE